MNGLMDERATSFLCYLFFFIERPLCSRHLFSQLLLLWAASCLDYIFSDPALSCLPASSSAGSTILLFAQLLQCISQRPAAIPQSTRVDCYNAFGNPQLGPSCNPAKQERRSKTHALLRAAVPMCRRRLKTCI